jgi:nicotinate-nucleotide adenylyltransferase
MNIGFFGGSFDPPHRGHLHVALAAARSFSLDYVLMAPTGNQPLKPSGAAASFADRLAMVSLLCRESALLKPSDLDAPLPDGEPNYTIETLRRLRSQLEAGDTLFVLTGADSFLDLQRWRQPDRLLELARWIVVSRPGFALDDLHSLHLTPDQLTRVHLLDELADPSSATEIRTQLALGEDCAGLLPPEIMTYIHARHLYGT